MKKSNQRFFIWKPKKRLNLARAIYKDPDINILDVDFFLSLLIFIYFFNLKI